MKFRDFLSDFGLVNCSRRLHRMNVLDEFRGQTLFLTGATGFLGKLLLERALQLDLRTIFVLVRPTDKTPSQRILVTLQSPVFGPLRAKLGKELGSGGSLTVSQFAEWAMRRISVVQGDLRQPSLGLSKIDEQRICESVDVVIHCGAVTPDFSKKSPSPPPSVPTSTASKIKLGISTLSGSGSSSASSAPSGSNELDVALQTNIIGSEEMLRVAKKIQNLKVFIFLSTAYAQKMKKQNSQSFFSRKKSSQNTENLNRNIFNENIPPLDFDVYKIVKKMHTKTAEATKLIETIKENYPNMHAFTKSLAEQILVANNNSLYSNSGEFPNKEKGSIGSLGNFKKTEKSVPLVFVRPSMIGCTYKDPMPGWTDNPCPVGSLLMWVSLGMVSVIPGDPNLIADVIPADFVVNQIFTIWNFMVKNHAKNNAQKSDDEKTSEKETGKTTSDSVFSLPNPMIFHCSTSSSSPLHWGYISRTASFFFSHFPPSRALILPPSSSITLVPTQFPYNFYFNVQHLLQDQFPNVVYKTAANLVQSPLHKQQSSTVDKLVQRSNNVILHGLLPFLTNEWLFTTKNTFLFLRENFSENLNFDPKKIDWHLYLNYYCYGVQKYILKEDISLPSVKELELGRLAGHKIHNTTNSNKIPMEQFHAKQSEHSVLFDDFRFSMFMNRNIHFPNSTFDSQQKIHNSIISSQRVKNAMSAVISGNPSLNISDLEKEAQKILSVMEARMNIPTIRGLGYFFRKVWKKLYHNIYVNSDGIEKIRALHTLQNSTKSGSQNSPSASIVYMPSHRSYIDFLMMSYILWEYSLPLPHIAAGEDFLGIKYVCELLRAGGAFFLRRSFKGDLLYSAIFTEYVQQLVEVGCPLEFFIEGTRSRSGKTLQPKYGLLGMITESFFSGRVSDIFFIPVHITYERTVEDQLYSREMLGRPKPRESLQGLVEARSILSQDYGRIAVKIGDPISLKSFVAKNETIGTKIGNQENSQKFSEEFCRKINNQLANSLVFEITEKTVWSPISLVSSVLLTSRFGISRLELIHHVSWLQSEILSKNRGCIDWISSSSSPLFSAPQSPSQIVTVGLGQLSHVVFTRFSSSSSSGAENSGNSTEGRASVQNQIEIVQPDSDIESAILLNFYRNRLIHLFFTEAAILCALHGICAQKKLNEGSAEGPDGRLCAGISEVLTEAAFLVKFLREEVILPADIESELTSSLDRLIATGVIEKISLPTPSSSSSPSSASLLCFHRNGLQHFPTLFYCNLLWPIIEAYWITCKILVQAFYNSPNSPKSVTNLSSENSSDEKSATISPFIEKPVVIERCLWLAQNLVSQGKIISAECCSKEYFGNSIISLKFFGILAENKSGLYSKEFGRENGRNLMELEKKVNFMRRTMESHSSSAKL